MPTTLKGRFDHRLHPCNSSDASTFCRPVVTAARADLTPSWLLRDWLVAGYLLGYSAHLANSFFPVEWSVGQWCGLGPSYAGTIVVLRAASWPPSTSFPLTSGPWSVISTPGEKQSVFLYPRKVNRAHGSLAHKRLIHSEGQGLFMGGDADSSRLMLTEG